MKLRSIALIIIATVVAGCATGGNKGRTSVQGPAPSIDYRDVLFTKAPAILAALAPEGLEKSDAAREELARKGLADSS